MYSSQFSIQFSLGNVQCSDTGYQDLNVSGTCFKVYSEGKSHADAMTQCHKDGGYLIQVTSAMKHEVVSQFIKSMTSTCNFHNLFKCISPCRMYFNLKKENVQIFLFLTPLQQPAYI